MVISLDPSAPGSNPKHNMSAFSIYIDKIDTEIYIGLWKEQKRIFVTSNSMSSKVTLRYYCVQSHEWS